MSQVRILLRLPLKWPRFLRFRAARTTPETSESPLDPPVTPSVMAMEWQRLRRPWTPPPASCPRRLPRWASPRYPLGTPADGQREHGGGSRGPKRRLPPPTFLATEPKPSCVPNLRGKKLRLILGPSARRTCLKPCADFPRANV